MAKKISGGRRPIRASNSPGSRARQTRNDIQGLRSQILSSSAPLSRTPGPSFDSASVRQRLSAERLRPYEQAAKGDIAAALRLYAWNAEMSAALFEQIGFIEVVLRNALVEQLLSLHVVGAAGREWYQRTEWFSFESQQDIERACKRVTTLGQTLSPSRVITELPLGFWRYLLSKHYHQMFWEPALRHAFPNLSRAIDRRGEVQNHVETVYGLRNRIAHHEPVFSRDHAADQDLMLELLGWMCADTREWVASCGRVYAVSGRRPEPAQLTA